MSGPCLTTPSKFLLRRDTAARWTSINPTLAAGEPGVETDTGQMKIGDGTSGWNLLPYVGTGGRSGTQGPTGAQGSIGEASTVTGPTGTQGTQGPTGTQGTQGPTGTQGTQGPAGVSGNGVAVTGPTGTQGPAGIQGPPGMGGGGIATYGMTLDAGGPTTEYVYLPAFDCGGVTGTIGMDFMTTLLYAGFVDTWVTK